MNLFDFIGDMERRQALAEACGTSSDYLWQLATGWQGRKPGPKLAKRIAEESARIGPEPISLESLRPDIWGEPPPTRRRKAA